MHLKDGPRRAPAAARGRDPGLPDALEARIFTELGNGVLDVLGVVRELARLDYSGWLMCEQDTTWRPPAESAAISRAVLAYALRLVLSEFYE